MFKIFLNWSKPQKEFVKMNSFLKKLSLMSDTINQRNNRSSRESALNKKRFRKNTLILLLTILSSLSFAQKTDPPKTESESEIDTDIDYTAQLVLDGLNKIRTENSTDSLEFNQMLSKASIIQSNDMAEKGKAILENSKGKYKTTAKRVIAMGGTKNTEEIVLSLSALKDKKQLTPQEIADAVISKWRSGKKELVTIKNGNYIYASPSVKIDAAGKKVFISVVFGSFNTFNAGVKKRKELTVRFTKKNKKIKAADEKACKNCEKFKDYEGLVNGLYLENGKIFLKYENMKAFSKLISKPKDGLAVDIVQRAQYEKPDYNILNTNLLSKGVLTKTVTTSKLFSKNRIKPEKKGGKVETLDVQLGILPKKLAPGSAYELNLLVIQNGQLCKTIIKSYVEQGDQNSTTTLKMLLMPDSAAYLKPPFQPKADNATLKFSIQFEKNKFEYKEEDILPFLNALQEPDFIIQGLYITAFSSIEGNAAENIKLQKKRSENIIKALAKLQKEGVVTTIKTDDSWSLFQMSMEGGAYDTLSKMTKEQAINEINSKPGLSAELEPFLSKQRFGEIVMDVTYDIAGPKEQKFSLSKFNQASKKGDITQSYKIQYYIGDQIRKKKYTPDAFTKMEIPNQVKFSGVLNNQVVLRYMAKNNKLTEEDQKEMNKLYALDPSNNYIDFNSLLCGVKLDTSIGDSKERTITQKRIDALYKTDVPKKYLDALNIEWQFKIIDAMDTVEGSEPVIQACTDKVKSFYNLKEASWQNNLKLSYIFARFKDYKFAANLLADFVKKGTPNEQVLFAYISYCAQMPELIKSRLFVTALEKAKKTNPERYCKLFGEPNLTFQVFDNPFVKENYANSKCN